MAPKRTKSQASSVTKRSRKALTLDDKMEIIRRYDRGQRTADIVRAMGISESTLRTIRASKDKITASVQLGSSGAAKRTHIVQNPGLKRTEDERPTTSHDVFKKEMHFFFFFTYPFMFTQVTFKITLECFIATKFPVTI